MSIKFYWIGWPGCELLLCTLKLHGVWSDWQQLAERPSGGFKRYLTEGKKVSLFLVSMCFPLESPQDGPQGWATRYKCGPWWDFASAARKWKLGWFNIKSSNVETDEVKCWIGPSIVLMLLFWLGPQCRSTVLNAGIAKAQAPLDIYIIEPTITGLLAKLIVEIRDWYEIMKEVHQVHRCYERTFSFDSPDLVDRAFMCCISLE